MKSNKLLIIFLNIICSLTCAGIIALFPIALLERILNNLYLIIIYLALSIVITIPISIKMWKKAWRKTIVKLKITENCIVWDTTKEVITIKLNEVISTKIYRNVYKWLNVDFEYIDGTQICLKQFPNNYYRFLKKHINSLPPIPKRERQNTFKDYFIAVKSFIIENKYKIIATIIGLVITILSIMLYVKNKDNLFIKITCSIVCTLYGAFEVYFCWVGKSKFINDKPSPAFFTLLFTIVYNGIVFGIMFILYYGFAGKPFTIDLMFYAIFSYPSFVIVALIILLIMSGI